MDIAIRAGEGIGGTRPQVQQAFQVRGEAHFYRGPRPRHCGEGERIFFLEHGVFHGYAVFHEYGWREAAPGSGAQSGEAIVVRPPFVPIAPPLQAPEGFNRGRWLWRYIDRHPETVQLLRHCGL